MEKISENLSENIAKLTELLPIGESFDIITRSVKINQMDGFLIGVNGMHDVGILQRVLSDLQNNPESQLSDISGVGEFINKRISGVRYRNATILIRQLQAL